MSNHAHRGCHAGRAPARSARGSPWPVRRASRTRPPRGSRPVGGANPHRRDRARTARLAVPRGRDRPRRCHLRVAQHRHRRRLVPGRRPRRHDRVPSPLHPSRLRGRPTAEDRAGDRGIDVVPGIADRVGRGAPSSPHVHRPRGRPALARSSRLAALRQGPRALPGARRLVLQAREHRSREVRVRPARGSRPGPDRPALRPLLRADPADPVRASATPSVAAGAPRSGRSSGPVSCGSRCSIT